MGTSVGSDTAAVPASLKSLPGRMKAARTRTGMTQRELAERARVSAEFVSRVERGVAVPSLETLLRLCDALGCTPNDLLLPSADAARALYDRLRSSPRGAAKNAIRAAEAILEYERSR
ncbi:MAG: helix-turn-helix transcriptional regulator [Myxococcota bacterium]